MTLPGISGVTWYTNKPDNPIVGDCYYDETTYSCSVFTGKEWEKITNENIPDDDYIRRAKMLANLELILNGC